MTYSGHLWAGMANAQLPAQAAIQSIASTALLVVNCSRGLFMALDSRREVPSSLFFYVSAELESHGREQLVVQMSQPTSPCQLPTVSK